MIRESIVAGTFYPGKQSELEALLKKYLPAHQTKEDVLGVVAPHAGYIYSGAVAGAVFSGINLPDEALILAPNHTSRGELFSLAPHTYWETPLGKVSISPELNNLIKKYCGMIDAEPEAHDMEHSAEVQLPFLQYLKPDIKISVIVIASDCVEDLKLFGAGLAKAIGARKKPVLIVASSDMTHYEPQESAEAKDKKAIDKILALDEEGLYKIIHQQRITMCGFAPTIAMLTAVKEAGASKGRLVKYATSGEVSGDYQQVVGYAGLIIK